MLLICLLVEAATFLLKLIVCQEHETSKPNHGGINVFVYGEFLSMKYVLRSQSLSHENEPQIPTSRNIC